MYYNVFSFRELKAQLYPSKELVRVRVRPSGFTIPQNGKNLMTALHPLTPAVWKCPNSSMCSYINKWAQTFDFFPNRLPFQNLCYVPIFLYLQKYAPEFQLPLSSAVIDVLILNPC